MSFENGRMYTCDRCSAQAFTKCTGEGEADGGYTRWNKFAGLPGWDTVAGIGNLCPTCAEQWQHTVSQFKQGKAL